MTTIVSIGVLMIREKRKRRIFALKTVSKLWQTKIAAVHSGIDPKDETDREKNERWLREHGESSSPESSVMIGYEDVGEFPREEPVTPGLSPTMMESGEESQEEWAEEGEPEERTGAVPYQEYLEQNVPAGQGGRFVQTRIDRKIRRWRTQNPIDFSSSPKLVKLYGPSKTEEEMMEMEEDFGAPRPPIPGNRQDLDGNTVAYDYFVVDPYNADLEQKYFGANVAGEWYPTSASLTLLWLAVWGHKGVTRDPSKPLSIPKNYPHNDSAMPATFYALDPAFEKFALDDIENIWERLEDDVLAGFKDAPQTIEYRSALPLLRGTRVGFDHETKTWQFSGTKHQNLLAKMKALIPEDRELVKILEKDVSEYPKLAETMKEYGDEDVVQSLVDEAIKTRFRGEGGRFEAGGTFQVGKYKDISKERMAEIRSIVIESIIKRVNEKMRGIAFEGTDAGRPSISQWTT